MANPTCPGIAYFLDRLQRKYRGTPSEAWPRCVEFRAELPKTGSGKIRKIDLT
jgi:acyl-coenzyme A synthetase/AMP-(fatty) acid ligase